MRGRGRGIGFPGSFITTHLRYCSEQVQVKVKGKHQTPGRGHQRPTANLLEPVGGGCLEKLRSEKKNPVVRTAERKKRLLASCTFPVPGEE